MDRRRYEAQYRITYFLNSKYPAVVAHASGAMEAEATWGTLLAYYLQKILLSDLPVPITLPHNQTVDFNMCKPHPYAQLQGAAVPS